MISGTLTTTGGYGSHNYTLAWTATQDIKANKTIFEYTLSTVGGSGSYTERNLIVSINEKDVVNVAGPTQRSPGQQIKKGTVEIPHNAEGNATAWILISADTGNGKYATANKGYTMPTIPQISQITTASNVTVNGQNVSAVAFEVKNARYTHAVKWTIGSYSHTETLEAGVKVVNYAIPTNWKRAFPNATFGRCMVTLTTYDGTKIVGTDERAIQLRCDGSEVPTFNLVITDALGFYEKIDAYVAGYSKLQAEAAEIAYKFGATLQSVTIRIGNSTTTGTETTATAESKIEAPGNIRVSITVKDSRGYETTKTETITAYSYALPVLGLSISRYRLENGEYIKDDEGDHAKIIYSVTISEIGTNALEKVVINYSAQGGDDEGTIEATARYGEYFIETSPEYVYQFEVETTDKMTTRIWRKQLSNAKTIMDVLKGGDGLAIGGVATDAETLDIFWNTKIRGTLSVEQATYQSYKDITTTQSVVIQSGKWVELGAFDLGTGAYHVNVTIVFPGNATGVRYGELQVLYNGEEQRYRLDEGFMDLRNASTSGKTYLKFGGNTRGNARFYVMAYQNTGANMTGVRVLYEWHKLY